MKTTTILKALFLILTLNCRAQVSSAAEDIQGNLRCEARLTPTHALKVLAKVTTSGAWNRLLISGAELMIGEEKVLLATNQNSETVSHAGSILLNAESQTPVTISGIAATSLTAVSIFASLKNDNEAGYWVTNKATLKIRNNLLFLGQVDDGYGQITETPNAYYIIE